ncbi:MAG: hypothetical protein A2Y40_08325 [Candidatus Margulisbacteria bacterium GWF2_35_9]|nr:MAG: hypothetical protein A2Y40_08325 [Candidatus Margulisbacteria bacterium GWF2_35_9]
MGLFDIFNKNVEEKNEVIVSDNAGNMIEDDTHNVAKDTLTEILDLMGFFNVVKILDFDKTFISLEIKGDDLGRIIGKEGNTLFAIQLILRSILSRKFKRPINIQLDANNYRERRMTALKSIAKDEAENAISSKTEISLKPMNAWERRIIHLTLQDNELVKTESVGKDQDRKVIIIPV